MFDASRGFILVPASAPRGKNPRRARGDVRVWTLLTREYLLALTQKRRPWNYPSLVLWRPQFTSKIIACLPDGKQKDYSITLQWSARRVGGLFLVASVLSISCLGGGLTPLSLDHFRWLCLGRSRPARDSARLSDRRRLFCHSRRKINIVSVAPHYCGVSVSIRRGTGPHYFLWDFRQISLGC